jgi:NADH-quinone oxidoreductase subunit J
MFILSALLWFDWGAQFLSYSLILVYVGAIMTIFLFAVHLLQVKNNTINKYLLIFFSLILTAISYYNYFLVNEKTTFIKFDLNQIAKSLYVDYGLGLICIGLILLVSIVSAVTMLKNPKIKVKQQLKPGKIIWDDEL